MVAFDFGAEPSAAADRLVGSEWQGELIYDRLFSVRHAAW
jgi:hypothetical protein